MQGEEGDTFDLHPRTHIANRARAKRRGASLFYKASCDQETSMSPRRVGTELKLLVLIRPLSVFLVGPQEPTYSHLKLKGIGFFLHLFGTFFSALCLLKSVVCRFFRCGISFAPFIVLFFQTPFLHACLF